jgi:hypothetical protein
VPHGGGYAGDLEPARGRGGGVLEGLRGPARTAEAAVADLDSPGVPDGAEHRLLVVPPDSAQLEVVVSAKLAGSGCGDATVDQDQLKPLGDSLTPEVVQHQFAGVILVGEAGTAYLLSLRGLRRVPVAKQLPIRGSWRLLMDPPGRALRPLLPGGSGPRVK